MEADTEPDSSLSKGIDDVNQAFSPKHISHTQKKKWNSVSSLLNKSSLNPLIAGLVPCSPSRAWQKKKKLYITKGLSVRPSTPLSLAQCLRGLVLHMEEQKSLSADVLSL